MMRSSVSRRRFLRSATAGATSLQQAAKLSLAASAVAAPTLAAASEKPAILGGAPVRTQRFPSWPQFDSLEERALLEVLRSGKWFRGNGKQVARFEEAYARALGAKACLATANGTSALFTSLNALGVQPGDEVIVPPYTFIATVNVVLLQHALPVFVDTDPETFQIDARKIEAAISERTTAIVPVHLGGGASDLDRILEIGRKHRIPVLEDACQSHLGEWRGRKLGTLGAAGCFSFQASKNLNSGEGGAITSNDEDFIERCYAFHANGRGRKLTGYDFSYATHGANLRLTEFQASILLAQMTRLEHQSRRREANANYLSSLLREIPGITPVRGYEGCTRNAYHLYMFRYEPESFAGLPRAGFLKALSKEGIPCSGGYSPLNLEPFLKRSLQSRTYKALYPERVLAEWAERTRCPANEQVCREAVWLTQEMMLAERPDMEQIADAARKIQANAEAIKAAV
jgi:perosamine synthetase